LILTPADQTLWREVAWNGIRFHAPFDWEIGKIGARYLMLEDESGPVLEIKWGPVKGTFSHQTHLRRLVSLHGKQLGNSVKEYSLPAGWKKALDRFNAKGFSWCGDSIGGRGVILYCHFCKKATLIQFFLKKTANPTRSSRRILGSFQDHPKDGQLFWSVFDIKARIPENFLLDRYRFDAGCFELALSSADLKLKLFRWGPASILLKDSDLVKFAELQAPDSNIKSSTLIKAGPDVVEWDVTYSSAGWRRAWRVLRKKAAFRWYRVWHLPGPNRILGVMAEGKKPKDSRFLESICAAYESL
jgi:hypothetical protein